jgi:hypothetical protein
VATNPPWGIRLLGVRLGDREQGADVLSKALADIVGDEPTDTEKLEECWRGLAGFLRAQCPGASCDDCTVHVQGPRRAGFLMPEMQAGFSHGSEPEGDEGPLEDAGLTCG